MQGLGISYRTAFRAPLILASGTTLVMACGALLLGTALTSVVVDVLVGLASVLEGMFLVVVMSRRFSSSDPAAVWTASLVYLLLYYISLAIAVDPVQRFVQSLAYVALVTLVGWGIIAIIANLLREGENRPT